MNDHLGSLKARRQALRARLDEIAHAVGPIVAGQHPADEMLGLLNAALETTAEAIEISQDERDGLLADLYRTRRELHERGQALQRADLVDLRQLVHAGLLNSAVVDGEARRRRESHGQRGAASIEAMRSDANLSGYLVCGFEDCNRRVDVAEGYSRCPEHRKSQPRQYITPDYKLVDLDAAMADAERRERRSRQELEAAERVSRT